MNETKVTVIDGAGDAQFVVTVADMADAVAQFGAANVAPGQTPSARHRWAGGLWVKKADADVLPEAKETAWRKIKEVRDKRLTGTFSSGGRVYDCDREAISMAAVLAMLSKSALDLAWTKNWTLADNTSVSLTADQVVIVARACDDYITALWATGRTLRARINAAATVAAVDAVTWP